jgi:hypothetical protein
MTDERRPLRQISGNAAEISSSRSELKQVTPKAALFIKGSLSADSKLLNLAPQVYAPVLVEFFKD